MKIKHHIFVLYKTSDNDVVIEVDKTDRTDVSAERTDANTERIVIDTEGTDADTERTDLNTESTNMDTERADIGTERTDVNTEITDVDTEKTDINTERIDINTEIIDIDTEVTDYDTERTDLNTERADADTERADADTERTDLNTERADIGTESTDANTKRTDMNTERNKPNNISCCASWFCLKSSNDSDIPMLDLTSDAILEKELWYIKAKLCSGDEQQSQQLQDALKKYTFSEKRVVAMNRICGEINNVVLSLHRVREMQNLLNKMLE